MFCSIQVNCGVWNSNNICTPADAYRWMPLTDQASIAFSTVGTLAYDSAKHVLAGCSNPSTYHTPSSEIGCFMPGSLSVLNFKKLKTPSPTLGSACLAAMAVVYSAMALFAILFAQSVLDTDFQDKVGAVVTNAKATKRHRHSGSKSAPSFQLLILPLLVMAAINVGTDAQLQSFGNGPSAAVNWNAQGPIKIEDVYTCENIPGALKYNLFGCDFLRI